MATGLEYLQGFGNHFLSESEKGALPNGQNSPGRSSITRTNTEVGDSGSGRQNETSLSTSSSAKAPSASRGQPPTEPIREVAPYQN